MEARQYFFFLVIMLSIIGIGCGSDNDSMVKDDDIVVKLEKLESERESEDWWETKFRIEVRNIGEKTAWDVEVEVEFLNKHGEGIDIYRYSHQKGRIKIGKGRCKFKIEELKPDSQISCCSGCNDCDIYATDIYATFDNLFIGNLWTDEKITDWRVSHLEWE